LIFGLVCADFVSSLVSATAGNVDEVSTGLIRCLQRDIRVLQETSGSGRDREQSYPCRGSKLNQRLLFILSIDRPNRNPINNPCVNSDCDADARAESRQDVSESSPESSCGPAVLIPRNVVQDFRGEVREH
jgi:hypothetical protein